MYVQKCAYRVDCRLLLSENRTRQISLCGGFHRSSKCAVNAYCSELPGKHRRVYRIFAGHFAICFSSRNFFSENGEVVGAYRIQEIACSLRGDAQNRTENPVVGRLAERGLDIFH